MTMVSSPAGTGPGLFAEKFVMSLPRRFGTEANTRDLLAPFTSIHALSHGPMVMIRHRKEAGWRSCYASRLIGSRRASLDETLESLDRSEPSAAETGGLKLHATVWSVDPVESNATVN